MDKNTQIMMHKLMHGEAELKKKKGIQMREDIKKWFYGPMYDGEQTVLDPVTAKHLDDLYKIIGI